MVAKGYYQFTSRVNSAGEYCFGEEGVEYFCANFSEFHFDKKLREIITVISLSYTNTLLASNNSVVVQFNETSLHYPSCGAVRCAPGNHVPINWELLEEQESNSEGENVNMISEVTEQADTKPKKPKKSSDITWVWIVLAVLGGIGVVLFSVGVSSSAFVVKKKISKRYALLDEEDEEIEMMEMTNSSFTFPDDEDPSETTTNLLNDLSDDEE
eukprot:CAMPEP_0117038910 /NCGR_PEP_ID=MMETSP0472-20121206/27342_1 /TAXON_ID=693140 ORGANISM="Tiarina fusus, Strain LIS" /NCGR_SAMPLE_ID=MMETSP0472 /ASSEMBLY_ACC=CAM_ASM_000603 /LENGTH=212 /DNA_ID=CAMNT_0004749255 /DNA_START=740 /DNA_END=1378 /DNA_ORIENTATION=+